jgi:HlyD family secretion protein
MTPEQTKTSLRRYVRLGFASVVLVLGVGTAWAAFARIQAAVIAPGRTVVETYSKKVQHREGGIVQQLNVTEGATVEAGQVLVVLDDTEDRASLGIIEAALTEWYAKRARLQAERDGAAEIEFPVDLLARKDEPDVAAILSGQRKLFETQRAGIVGRKDQLTERIGQFNEEIKGLDAQIAAKAAQFGFIQDELTGLKSLQSQGLVQTGKVLALEREAARLEGERGQLVAQLASTRGQIAEAKLQIIQLEDDYRTRSLADLRETEGQISEHEERRVAIQSKLQRTIIKAPISGFIHQLAVHTIGGVITPGETIMQIVPTSDEIIIEAEVRPQDIEQIHVGQTAVLHFPGLERRTTPRLYGEVTQISADLTKPEMPGAQPFFAVRLKLGQSELKKLEVDKLVPGMPAEAFIQTRERSPIDYLLQPLTDQVARTFRER